MIRLQHRIHSSNPDLHDVEQFDDETGDLLGSARSFPQSMIETVKTHFALHNHPTNDIAELSQASLFGRRGDGRVPRMKYLFHRNLKRLRWNSDCSTPWRAQSQTTCGVYNFKPLVMTATRMPWLRVGFFQYPRWIPKKRTTL